MIIIKSDREIKIMRESGLILTETLKLMKKSIKPGITTWELDKIAEDFIRSKGGIPSFKGYGGFPATLCTSINEVLIHGIPSKNVKLKEGDIISIDCGVFYKNFHSDAADTFLIGKVPEKIQKLVEVTRNSFLEGVKFAKPGYRLYDISAAIGNYVKKNGFFVVKEYVGHGIGRNLHEDPAIPNYGKANTGPLLKKGMTFAIEPMVLINSPRVYTKSDGWTVVSSNNLPTAHFERTIAVTENGFEYLVDLEI